ncbi:hypothetical protein B0T20DRAFT_488016 [Sordaria brevicollis]|uniref:Uncharacterized protein n=1 Tax=Sordaria brevicollis TaxID=83679 RepID=A0AAE0U668_SORBR|nr:hypothetical protein B0T20DRAFT_488016 [Sordaria brevicollis]
MQPPIQICKVCSSSSRQDPVSSFQHSRQSPTPTSQSPTMGSSIPPVFGSPTSDNDNANDNDSDDSSITCSDMPALGSGGEDDDVDDNDNDNESGGSSITCSDVPALVSAGEDDDVDEEDSHEDEDESAERKQEEGSNDSNHWFLVRIMSRGGSKDVDSFTFATVSSDDDAVLAGNQATAEESSKAPRLEVGMVLTEVLPDATESGEAHKSEVEAAVTEVTDAAEPTAPDSMALTSSAEAVVVEVPDATTITESGVDSSGSGCSNTATAARGALLLSQQQARPKLAIESSSKTPPQQKEAITSGKKQQQQQQQLQQPLQQQHHQYGPPTHPQPPMYRPPHPLPPHISLPYMYAPQGQPYTTTLPQPSQQPPPPPHLPYPPPQHFLPHPNPYPPTPPPLIQPKWTPIDPRLQPGRFLTPDESQRIVTHLDHPGWTYHNPSPSWSQHDLRGSDGGPNNNNWTFYNPEPSWTHVNIDTSSGVKTITPYYPSPPLCRDNVTGRWFRFLDGCWVACRDEQKEVIGFFHPRSRYEPFPEMEGRGGYGILFKTWGEVPVREVRPLPTSMGMGMGMGVGMGMMGYYYQ